MNAFLLPILRGTRKEMCQQEEEHKADIEGLCTELKAAFGDACTELRTMNGRLDGTNMRGGWLVVVRQAHRTPKGFQSDSLVVVALDVDPRSRIYEQ